MKLFFGLICLAYIFYWANKTRAPDEGNHAQDDIGATISITIGVGLLVDYFLGGIAGFIASILIFIAILERK
jgi:hypothetical protein